MALLDFIRPKWRHSDPLVRLNAVGEMTEAELDRLKEIAGSDPDERVRIAALEKIDEERFLCEILSQYRETETGQVAAHRLGRICFDRIMAPGALPGRIKLMRRLEDAALLTRIACEADDPDLRLAACEGVTDEAVLCDITERNCGPKVGMAVVSRIVQTAHLSRIAECASNKKVKKAAREKLTRLTRPEPARDRITPEMDALVAQLKAMVHMGVDDSGRQRLAQIEEQWRALGSAAEREADHAFHEVLDLLKRRYAAHERAEAAREAFIALCREAEAGPAASVPVDSFIADLKARWEAVDGSDLARPEHQELTERLVRACQGLRERERAAQVQAQRREALADLCLRLEAPAAEAADLEALLAGSREAWQRLAADGAVDDDLGERYAIAQQRIAQRIAEREAARKAAGDAAAAQLTALCERVEAAVDAEERAGLDQTVRQIQAEWPAAGADAPEVKAAMETRFQDACNRFFERQRTFYEERDWERWANLNQKEELCRVAELLAGQADSAGAGQIVWDLRKKWKAVGPVEREKSETVWQRFNAACDAVFHRCLERKTEICDAATGLMEAVDFDAVTHPADLTETVDRVKELQGAWQAVGALPNAMEADLRERFQAACDLFFARLRTFFEAEDQRREENLREKTALCREAESLAGSDQWRETGKRLKALQKRWKEVGPLPKGEGNALWERFRSACDAFFERRKSEEPENLRRKTALCLQAEALAREADQSPEADMAGISRELIELQQQWKEIGPVPAGEARALWQRFRHPCDTFFEMRKQQLEVRSAEQQENETAKRHLVEEAEALADSTTWRETAEQLKGLQQQWRETGPASRDAEPELWQRFKTACDRFFTRRSAHFDALDQQRNENTAHKERLCITLEALGRLVLQGGQAGEGELQPSAEQLQAALELKDEVVVPGNPKVTWARAVAKVKALQQEWKNIGPGRSDQDGALWDRFRGAADLFFSDSGTGADRPETPPTRPEPISRSAPDKDHRIESNRSESRS